MHEDTIFSRSVDLVKLSKCKDRYRSLMKVIISPKFTQEVHFSKKLYTRQNWITSWINLQDFKSYSGSEGPKRKLQCPGAIVEMKGPESIFSFRKLKSQPRGNHPIFEDSNIIPLPKSLYHCSPSTHEENSRWNFEID